jgi:GT2 family glycosyltransferase
MSASAEVRLSEVRLSEVRLSIVIVSWNTRQFLRKCLASIEQNPPEGPFEVLVVDNASSDSSAEMVRSRFPQVRLIANQKNAGFAAANNQAIHISRGAYVLLLNPDTEVKPGALQTLVAFMDDHPQAGGAGARLLNPAGSADEEPSLQPSSSPAPGLGREFARLFHLPGVRADGYYEMSGWDLGTPRLVEVLLGACLLVRRSVLDQIGLLDEGYFIYSEETDLCTRIRRAGYQLFWVPQAQVIHSGGQSTRQAAEDMFLQLYQSKVRYFRKHHGWAAVLMYKAILIAAAVGRLLVTPVALIQQEPRRERRLVLSRHYSRLLIALLQM